MFFLSALIDLLRPNSKTLPEPFPLQALPPDSEGHGTEDIASDTPALQNLRLEVETYLDGLSADPPDGATYSCPHGVSCIEYEMFAVSWHYSSGKIQGYYVDLFCEEDPDAEPSYGMEDRVQARWSAGDHGISRFVAAWRERYEAESLKPYIAYLKTTVDPPAAKAANILSLVPDATDADCSETDCDDDENKVN